MADQGRWFKVWVSVLDDPDFQELSLEDVGRWTLLGALTKMVGTHGTLTITGTGRRLCQVLHVESLAEVKSVLDRLPHVVYTPVQNRHGTFTVTFQNWTKYQEDSTQARRASASRSKKRREEKRREESNPPSVFQTDSPPSTDWPETLREVREHLVTRQAPPQLLDPVFWHRIDDWLGAPDSGVGYLTELDKYLAWLAAQPRSAGHRDLKRGFRNWLAKSEYWSDRRAQTEAHRQRGRR